MGKQKKLPNIPNAGHHRLSVQWQKWKMLDASGDPAGNEKEMVMLSIQLPKR